MKTTKAQRKFELYSRLASLGFTFEESAQLRRIEMTLQRWAGQECGDSNNYSSWSVERDEMTNKPFKCVYPHTGEMHRYPIADREAGALRRCKAIIDARNQRTPGGKSWSNWIIFYHQTDPRGCALYLVTHAQLDGASIDSVYTRGLAVCS